jgi:electron transport complex protein RnfG
MLKDMTKPAIVLTLVCLVITAALAVVNGITKPVIDEGIRQAKLEALAKVYPGVDSFSEPITAEQLKNSGYGPSNRIVAVYEAVADGVTKGYVVDVATKGYGGNINILVSIDMDMNIMNTIVMSHTETPGFGSNIVNGFMDQFLGKVPDDGYRVVKKAKTRDGDIEALTGATITSRAAVDGLSDAVAIARDMIEGGK